MAFGKALMLITIPGPKEEKKARERKNGLKYQAKGASLASVLLLLSLPPD